MDFIDISMKSVVVDSDLFRFDNSINAYVKKESAFFDYIILKYDLFGRLQIASVSVMSSSGDKYKDLLQSTTNHLDSYFGEPVFIEDSIMMHGGICVNHLRYQRGNIDVEIHYVPYKDYLIKKDNISGVILWMNFNIK